MFALKVVLSGGRKSVEKKKKNKQTEKRISESTWRTTKNKLSECLKTFLEGRRRETRRISDVTSNHSNYFGFEEKNSRLENMSSTLKTSSIFIVAQHDVVLMRMLICIEIIPYYLLEQVLRSESKYSVESF